MLAFFGILLSRETKHPVHLTKVFFLWVAGFWFLVILLSVGLYQYSTDPRFCNSCHIMEPYFKAWETSKHGGKAACVECHYPPPKTLGEHFWHKFQASAQVVKYITRTYSSKPFADIQDASCLRSGCHSYRLLEGKIISERGVKFDHRPHLTETRRGRQLRCVSCHSQIVVGKHIEVTYDTCFLCHFREPERAQAQRPALDCLDCHEIPAQSFRLGEMTYNHKDFVTQRGVACRNCHIEVTQGEGKAEQERCFTCHNQPEKLARYNDIPFLHENHVTKHHVACLHCHEEMPHGRHAGEEGVAETPPWSRPETRHAVQEGRPPTLTFDCGYCHENKHAGQLMIYTGRISPLNLGADMPSPMYLANVDCIGCHYEEKTGEGGGTAIAEKTFKASEEACVKCHGPSFKGIWEETRTELTAALGELDKKLSQAQAALEVASLPAKEIEEKKGKILQVRQWNRFVKGSHGEHNIYLASRILREEDNLLSQVGTELKAPLPDLSSLPLLSGGYCAVMCHATVGVKVPPETVQLDSLPVTSPQNAETLPRWGGMGVENRDSPPHSEPKHPALPVQGGLAKTMPHQMHTTMMGCVSCHEIGTHKSVPLKEGVRESLCKGCHP